MYVLCILEYTSIFYIILLYIILLLCMYIVQYIHVHIEEVLPTILLVVVHSIQYTVHILHILHM